VPAHYSVKEAVFPFLRFEGINISLGPEMKSTGEVMGIDADLGLAFAKSQLASHWPLPVSGNVFISVKDVDKQNVIELARQYAQLGFGLVATSGTGRPDLARLTKKSGEFQQGIINAPDERHAHRHPGDQQHDSVLAGPMFVRHVSFFHFESQSPLKWKCSATGRTKRLQIRATTSKPAIRYIVGA
jgi:hypothetical protein